MIIEIIQAIKEISLVELHPVGPVELMRISELAEGNSFANKIVTMFSKIPNNQTF